jgi:branched-chain amino acid transport system substrate-binding protein
MNRQGKKAIGLIAAVVLVSFLVAGRSGGSDPKTGKSDAKGEYILKVGSSVSLSGNLALEGTETKLAREIWKTQINSMGGIKVGGKQYKVEIVYYDDKSDAQTAAKLTEKLITEDKVKFLFGPYSSGITDATATISERYKVLTFAASANSDALYSKGRKYLFGVAARATTDLYNTIKMFKELDPKLKTMAIVTPDALASLLWAEGAKKAAEQFGLEVVSFQKYPLPAKDMSSVALSVKSKNPDILIAPGYVGDSVLLFRQLKDARFTPKAIGTASPIISNRIFEMLGKDAEGICSIAQFVPTAKWSDPVYGSVEKYVKLLEQNGVKQFNDRFGQSAAAGVAMKMAIEKAGTIDDVEKVRDAMLNLDLETVLGRLKFDVTGFNAGRIAAVVQAQNSKFVPVYPEAEAAAKPVYPLVPWEKR